MINIRRTAIGYAHSTNTVSEKIAGEYKTIINVIHVQSLK